MPRTKPPRSSEPAPQAAAGSRGSSLRHARQVNCNMTRQERLDVGEKIFVGAFVGSVVIEVLLTLFAVSLIVGHNAAWAVLTTVLLGAVFVGFLMFLANWLYSGDRTAWKTAVGWGGFQVALSLFVIAAFLASRTHPGF